jgi:hypothetical protein
MLRLVALVRTCVSEEGITSIIRMIRVGKLGMLAVTSSWSLQQRNTYHPDDEGDTLQEPLGITFQKTAFFMQEHTLNVHSWSRLTWSSCSMCVHVSPPINFFMPEQILMKFAVCWVEAEPISVLSFVNSFDQCVCVCVCVCVCACARARVHVCVCSPHNCKKAVAQLRVSILSVLSDCLEKMFAWQWIHTHNCRRIVWTCHYLCGPHLITGKSVGLSLYLSNTGR